MIAAVLAVMRHLVDIYRTDLVAGVDQLVLDVPGQVAQVEEAPVAIAEEEAETFGVVAGVDRLRLVVLRLRVLGSAGLVGNDLAAGAEDDELHLGRSLLLLERQRVAGLDGLRLAAVRRLVIANQDGEALLVIVERIGNTAIVVVGD